MNAEPAVRARPVVSINVPCYQQLPHLRSSLATILAQTLPDFEVNILDDGRSDEYREYIATLGDSRVHYTPNPERLGAMRNIFRAIFSGTGQYSLAFHEDDLLEPNYLAAAVNILESHRDCGFVAAEVREFSTGPASSLTRSKSDCPAYEVFRSGAEFVRGIFRGVEPMFGSVVYRREAITGLQPDHERFGTLVDRPFLLSILDKWSAAVIREPVAWYRGHGEVDERHGGMTAAHILELLKTYRALLPKELPIRDKALFFSYAADWLGFLYRLTPDEQKPSFGRFMFRAWREGVYDPRWERRFGLGRIRRAVLSGRPAVK
jgi:glycosyltransferase involved in cell wall biosynthesis